MNLNISRRRFAQLVIANATLAAFGQLELGAVAQKLADSKKKRGLIPRGIGMQVKMRVNGQDRSIDNVDPRTTLLDVLRERLHLTGSKKGCDHGQCGACTVIVNGKRINSCLALAVMQQGKEIRTIEGLAHGEDLHPMQAAFIEHDGFQCGYCTSGQIMSAVALLHEPCGKSDAEVKECMSGNLCRCGAYPNIVAAIQDVRSGGKI